MGGLSVKNIKAMLQSNEMQNFPVTEKDTNPADNIFGPENAVLKGNSVKTTPNQETYNTTAVPKEKCVLTCWWFLVFVSFWLLPTMYLMTL